MVKSPCKGGQKGTSLGCSRKHVHSARLSSCAWKCVELAQTRLSSHAPCLLFFFFDISWIVPSERRNSKSRRRCPENFYLGSQSVQVRHRRRNTIGRISAEFCIEAEKLSYFHASLELFSTHSNNSLNTWRPVEPVVRQVRDAPTRMKLLQRTFSIVGVAIRFFFLSPVCTTNWSPCENIFFPPPPPDPGLHAALSKGIASGAVGD